MSGKGLKVAVVGGGIVGVSNALALQKAGHQVTLIDRRAPGRETSYGNAGVLSESSVGVLNSPGLLKSLPKLLLGKSNSVQFSPTFVLRRLGWMLSFLSYCTRRHWRAAGHALRALQVISLDQHKAWIAEAGVDNLLRYGGWMKVFRRGESYEAYKAELELADEVGTEYSIFDREQIRQIEPGLKPIYEKAVLYDNTCGVSNPAALTDAYVRLFTEAGGTVLQASVTGLSRDAGAWHVAFADRDSLDADGIVIAAGPWSSEIAGWLGYDLPLAWERGYHMHLEPGEGPQLNRAVHDVDGGFAIVPMQQGVRITTGVEIAARDAPPNYSQVTRSVELARDGHEMKGEIDETPWMGRRPTMVDSLPVIGPAPRHSRLWFNFGHQHIGLSMGPGSGLAIAAMIAGEAPPIDMSPFRPTRFSI